MLETKPHISLVVPAFNEAKRIESTLVGLFSNDLLLAHEYEVLVMMDGCTDGTEELVQELISHNKNISAVIHPNRLGKGGAIIEALKHTQGDVIAFIDADGSIPLLELEKLISLIGKYDLVIGSRYEKNSILPVNRPMNRVIFSRAFNTIVKILFWRLHNIRDTQCGVKVFSRHVIDRIKCDLIITDFAFDVNLLYSSTRHGFAIKEVGITWIDKNGGKLSGGLTRIPFFMAFSLIKLRFYYSVRALTSSKIFRIVDDLLYNLSKR